MTTPVTNDLAVKHRLQNHRMVEIFDVPVHSRPHGDVLSEMNRHINGPRRPLRISITSSELMYHARRVPFVQSYIRNSHLSLCDGAGVAINGLLRGVLIRRFTGPMLMEASFAYGAQHGWRHFFCGGAEGVADALVARIAAKTRGFISAGTYCPPFREPTPAEEQSMIDAINSSGADVLWVGLGVVRQEQWIEKYIGRLNVPWVVGVGGGFDYFAGTASRAPRWVRALGFEWFYRVCHEPWRYRRTSTLLMFGVEGALDAVFGRAPFLGSGPTTSVTPPEWKPSRKRIAAR